MTNYYKNTDKEPKPLVDLLAGNRQSLTDRIIDKPRNVNEFLPTTSAAPEGFEGSSKAVYTHNDSQSAVTDSMNKNSGLWWEAKAAGDTDWMKSLETANKQLAALLGDGVSYNSSSGTWSGVADMPATMQASMTTGVNPVMPTYDYEAWLKDNPAPTYQSAYNAQIDQLMNQLLNREDFSYNAETDPLFQQYQKQYTREGTRSMNDTLAAAASGAGGMNSAAITAAQQANNYYMAQLGDKIPELQQLAYDMYLNDLNLQRQDGNMLMDKEGVDYNRYRDSMSDWYNSRDFGYNQYRDQMGDYQWGTQLNYGAYRDQVADDRYKTEWEHALEREAVEDEWRNKEWDYGVSRDQVEDAWRDKEWNYGVGRDQISDSRYNTGDAYDRAMDLLMNGVMPNSDLLAQAGISESSAADLLSKVSSDDNGWNGDDLPEDDPNSESKFWNSVNALGIGPVNAITIEEIANYGGITENADGTVKWANGWNASNYKEKLKQAKSFSFGMFLP